MEQVLEGSTGGEIIFQVELACLCGSDLLFFDGDYEEYPPLVGHSLHEMTGTVLQTTGQRFRRGDRVLCVPENQMGLAERFRVSELRAIPLDPRPSEEEALLAQPLGTVIYALRKLSPSSITLVGLPGGSVFSSGGSYLGERLYPIQADYFAALREDRLRQFLAGHRELVNPFVELEIPRAV